MRVAISVAVLFLLSACSYEGGRFDGTDLEIAANDCVKNGGVRITETDHNFQKVWCNNNAYFLHDRHNGVAR